MADTSNRTPITNVRFDTYDLACLDAVRAATGLSTRAEVLRQGIRALAKKEGVELPDPKGFTNGEGKISKKRDKKA